MVHLGRVNAYFFLSRDFASLMPRASGREHVDLMSMNFFLAGAQDRYHDIDAVQCPLEGAANIAAFENGRGHVRKPGCPVIGHHADRVLLVGNAERMRPVLERLCLLPGLASLTSPPKKFGSGRNSEPSVP